MAILGFSKKIVMLKHKKTRGDSQVRKACNPNFLFIDITRIKTGGKRDTRGLKAGELAWLMVARYNFFPGIGKVDNRDDYSYSDCGFLVSLLTWGCVFKNEKQNSKLHIVYFQYRYFHMRHSHQWGILNTYRRPYSKNAGWQLSRIHPIQHMPWKWKAI